MSSMGQLNMAPRRTFDVDLGGAEQASPLLRVPIPSPDY
ncbi:hypothetical protein CGMCC3_g6654 [Colletotrichum fructicola]|nr:uncharacterized protein CGMCC3_g6654 [Colletotrichum fructicola]KAE9577404.1 hypothetical protein CGMCC3_g6654 [Colletotrichum fructicola]